MDIVYKRVVVNEFVKAFATPDELMAHPLVRAVQDQAVCMVNSFNCQMLYSKAIFALISDEENGHLFDEDERAAVKAHIPWTRFVEERTTRFEGQAVDLVSWIRQHKDDLVLKPVKEYGGTGVILGWETDPESWAAEVEIALSRPSIVQKRVPTPQAIFPICEDGALRLVEPHGRCGPLCVARTNCGPRRGATGDQQPAQCQRWGRVGHTPVFS